MTVGDLWAVLLEKEDGSKQTCVGVAAETLTAPFPMVGTKEALQDIVKNAPKNKQRLLSSLRVPPETGGSPDILIGIKYQSIMPEIIHQLPSGLFIAKVRLKSHNAMWTAAIGGPHTSFTQMIQQCGDTARLLSCFITSLKKLF